jgi:ribosomal biogenesis protein LAS1
MAYVYSTCHHVSINGIVACFIFLLTTSSVLDASAHRCLHRNNGNLDFRDTGNCTYVCQVSSQVICVCLEVRIVQGSRLLQSLLLSYELFGFARDPSIVLMSCRFVTGLLDGHQVKQKKMSMYSIAKSIGLPATYVELRHQATHEELPSLSKLRTATQKALRWIWEYYWVKLAVESPPIANNDCKAFIRRIVHERDATRQSELESNLSSWDEDELLMALLEVQWVSKDPEVLLRCVNLHRKVTGGGSTPKMSAKNSKSGSPTSKLEKMRAEMTQMNEGLDEVEVEASVKEKGDMDVDEPESGMGWALWEGPWVPKPIGVV